MSEEYVTYELLDAVIRSGSDVERCSVCDYTGAILWETVSAVNRSYPLSSYRIVYDWRNIAE